METSSDTRPIIAVCSDPAPGARIVEVLEAQDVVVSGVFENEQDVVGVIPAPDVVVLRANGATLRARMVRALRAGLPGVQVIAVGAAAKGHEVRSTMEAGAGGFVFEEELETTLGLTIRIACAGQIAVPRRERRQVERPTLSAREKQILGLVVMGFMNCEIAERLFLAESTVKSHLSSAFSKLGVRSRNEAVDLILDGEDGLGRGILAITSDLPAGSSPSIIPVR